MHAVPCGQLPVESDAVALQLGDGLQGGVEVGVNLLAERAACSIAAYSGKTSTSAPVAAPSATQRATLSRQASSVAG
ncbi:MAG: hypothetical protein WDN31_14595 [Hyphomicrobium sp.]